MSRGKSTKRSVASSAAIKSGDAVTSGHAAKTLFLVLSVVALIAASAAAWWTTRPGTPSSATQVTSLPPIDSVYVGSDSCSRCHAEAYIAWQNSQHAHAMQHATADTVLGNFDETGFSYSGIESTFFKRGDKFFVRTDGPDGKLTEFEITYTFGVAPLQQYLVPFPDGRLQALSIAWNSQPKDQGGQRWFHLYPGENVNYRDELHWTRRSQNWNFMCADCHSTEVKKNYNASSDTYDTTWNEISVGCEACHGPASAHLEWTKDKPADTNMGLTVSLSERNGVTWIPNADTGKPVRSRPRQSDVEIQVCAQCHSRRSQVTEGYHAGMLFQDFYRPALLTPDLYYADGQQLGEVYKWGSFVQSRMYHAGVTCGDCHDPHTQKLRAEGNAVCGTCHLATRCDTQAHHHHAGEAAGTRCVDCHMPPTNYMVVDPRHDHGMRVPRPDLSVTLGTPNACTGCHQQQDASWAAATVTRWYGHEPGGFQRYAEVFVDAERGAPGAARDLAWFTEDRAQPAIARATALETLARFPTQDTIEAARTGLKDSDPLVRRASLGTLALLPPDQRLPLVTPLLTDPVRSIRMEAASVLADAMGAATASQRAVFTEAAAEYEASQRYNADRPEARAALGNFYARQGRLAEAETEIRSALTLGPDYIPAYLNLADLMRARGRDADAERSLQDGLLVAPDSAALHHALGLTLVRMGRSVDALMELQRATKINPADPRFAYVYAVALNSSGDAAAAIHVIEEALILQPNDRDLLSALVFYQRDAGNLSQALEAAEKLGLIFPNDPGVQRLLMEVRAIQPR
jgi:Flp pilus assembly protein TadD